MFCECGTGSFKYVDEDLDDVGCAGGSPKRRKKHGGGKVNPYAELGLDRFSVVLSDLQTRRANILRRVGSDTGLVLVRFVQSDGDWAPIVVKLPDEVPPKAAFPKKPRPPRPAPASSGSSPDPASPRERGGAIIKKAAAAATKVPARRASFSLGRRVRRPSCYWPYVIVLTLVSLAVFGRVFAICLTSIWWYLIPTIGSRCSDGAGVDAPRAGRRMSMEKKRLVSPLPPSKKGGISGVLEAVSSPTVHAKGKRD